MDHIHIEKPIKASHKEQNFIDIYTYVQKIKRETFHFEYSHLFIGYNKYNLL